MHCGDEKSNIGETEGDVPGEWLCVAVAWTASDAAARAHMGFASDRLGVTDGPRYSRSAQAWEVDARLCSQCRSVWRVCIFKAEAAVI
jgi:hypothetical protein